MTDNYTLPKTIWVKPLGEIKYENLKYNFRDRNDKTQVKVEWWDYENNVEGTPFPAETAREIVEAFPDRVTPVPVNFKGEKGSPFYFADLYGNSEAVSIDKKVV